MVFCPAEENEDEGQQGGVDVQQYQLGVEVALAVPGGFADTGKVVSGSSQLIRK